MTFNKKIKISILSATCISVLTGCQLSTPSNEIKPITNQTTFVEALKEFPRAEKNLRQWDTPVVADLDKDGYPDIILNDHGFAIRIMWNNQGTYEKPYDLIMGDVHGVSVGDFDKDGDLNLIISRGGGSGSNARNSIIYKVDSQRKFTVVEDFDKPLEFMRGRTVKFFDGDNDGDLDLINFAFPSQDKKDQSENYIYRNNGKKELLLDNTLPKIHSNGQKILVTDINSDNVLDFVMYGHGAVKVYQGKGDLTYADVTQSVLPTPLEGINGIVEIDYDNDGDFDLFFTRGKDFVAGETFFDKKTKTLGLFSQHGVFDFKGIIAGDVLNIENFHTQWPHTGLFLGETSYEYQFPGETHIGRDVRLVNSDTLGFPDKPQKDGVHIGYIGNNEWRIAGDFRPPFTAIIHNVDSYPAYNHPEGVSDIFLENRNGKFIDVSKEVNLDILEHSMGVTVADIDNNGYQDLVVIKRGNLINANESLVYLNNGLKSFELSRNHGVITTELGAIGFTVEPVDFNIDGKIDLVVGNERGKWHLFENSAEQFTNNNYLVIKVGNAPSEKSSALGALVKVEACGNSQMKRVGSTGASYSLSFDSNVHFGLGACKQPAKVSITWSNNEVLNKTFDTLNTQVVMGNKA